VKLVALEYEAALAASGGLDQSLAGGIAQRPEQVLEIALNVARVAAEQRRELVK
jgi:hypothetical protein